MPVTIVRRPFAVACLVAALVAAACSPSDEQAQPPPSPLPSPPAAGRFASAKPTRSVPKPADNWRQAGCGLPLDYLRRIRRGYFPGRSPDVLFVPRKPNFFGGFTSTTHSGPWPYVQRIPLVLYGPGYVKPRGLVHYDREVTLVDLAPTLADLVGLRWPGARPGTALDGVFKDRPKPPKVVLTIVWDGGGWDVLDEWPHAWPHLQRMMSRGVTVGGATVGTSPSVTPASHATLGTGTWPRTHGIVDIPQREAGDIVASFPGRSPQLLETSTFADLFDRSTGNRAQVGMIAYLFAHLGMMGHGAQMEGGDLDTAVIADGGPGDLITNPSYYSLPSYLQTVPGYEDDIDTVDRVDGKADEKWMGHDLGLLDIQRHSPVWELYQTRLLKALMTGEGYGDDNVTDLLFVNYKEIDDAGHNWNMLNPEMRSTLRFADDVLGSIEHFLNRTVGKRSWVIALTADHGQAPDPRAVGAWPIRMQVLTKDLAARWRVAEDDLLQDERPVGLWLDAATLDATGISKGDVANWLIDYRLEDNVPVTEKLSGDYARRAREPVFSAAFPGDALDRLVSCAKRRLAKS
jgi:arylsulfatase A-like enzyme